MADENGSGPDGVTKNFGLVIAFLLPGFIALWGISYFDPRVEAWINRASSGSTSVGDFLLVVVASLGLGVFLSGVRWLLFEQFRFLKLLRVEDVTPHAQRGTWDDRQANEDFYKFYLFYSNTAVAMLLVFSASLHAQQHWTLFSKLLALVAAEVVLVWSARESIRRFREKVKAHRIGVTA
ncbi:MAG: hypothetical protein M3167_16660 [Acidobacteriota bacterium]|nr:hypothetical protein [Acidobacteriota bacterium]